MKITIEKKEGGWQVEGSMSIENTSELSGFMAACNKLALGAFNNFDLKGTEVEYIMEVKE